MQGAPSPLPPGLLAAAGILIAWALALGAGLGLRPGGAGGLLVIAATTFAYTGLFITAHDAMHGSVAPGRPRLNAAVGALAAGLYAAFGYARLRRAHLAHHAAPGTPADPDTFAPERGPRFGPWYRRFMGHYLSVGQLGRMAAAFAVLGWGLGIPVPALLLYWVLPNLLSTLQLFYFGTYRVHRPPPGGHRSPHRATSEAWPAWATFLSCYHFGLHARHHERPELPWFALRREG